MVNPAITIACAEYVLREVCNCEVFFLSVLRGLCSREVASSFLLAKTGGGEGAFP